MYLNVRLVPLNSRLTVKETSSPLILPSSISVLVISPPWPGELRVPVSFSPSVFNFSVILRSGPPLRPGVVQVQVPVGSAFLSSARLNDVLVRLKIVQSAKVRIEIEYLFASFIRYFRWDCGFSFPILRLTGRCGKHG